MSHITGGGIIGNTSRVLPEGRGLRIDWGRWTVPPIFRTIQMLGNVPEDDMRRTFNLGVGFILIVPPDHAGGVREELARQGEETVVVGEIT
jgi:phosphoribosylformylglycinamidine cyclo-ligase